MKHIDPELQWTPFSESGWTALERTAAMTTFEYFLRHWEGTPYESGQRMAGLGADCIGSVFGVVDDLDGLDRGEAPGMPRDTAMHNRNQAVGAMREIVRRYAPNMKLKMVDGIYQVQPGDIIVTGVVGGGPGHVSIVGPRKNTIWEAVPSTGFAMQGWSFFEEQDIWAVYRLNNRREWL